MKSLQEKGEIIVAVEEIDTRKEMVDAMTDVEEMITKKAEIGIVQNAITPILHSERSVTAVKQIDLEMVQVSLKENSTEEEKIPKNLEIGLVLSVTILTSPSEINAIAVKQIDLEMVQVSLKENSTEEEKIPKNLEIGLALSVTILTSPSEINATGVKPIDLVLVANQNPEAEAMNAVVLDLKEEIPVVEEDDHPVVLASHVDLDSEALVEAALEVIDQEEVAVGAEFGTPQHSFCLNPSKPYGEQGGYALGRSSRA